MGRLPARLWRHRHQTECEARNVDFLWGSITAQCEDVDSYAEEQRALGGEEDCDRDGPRSDVTPRTYPQYAGYRSCVVNRWTRTRICVVDGVEAHWDTDIRSGGGHGSRWYTTCEDHNMQVSHRTLKLARAHAGSPWGWCERCRKTERKNR